MSKKTGLNLVNKVSIASVVGKIGKPEAPQALMRVLGLATTYETGETQYGEFIAFKGSFEATNLMTGEVFRAGKCFLPDVAANLMSAQLAASSGETGFKGVQFAFEIGYKPSDTLIGYEYTVTPLIEIDAADPLTALRDQLGALPQLENKPKSK